MSVLLQNYSANNSPAVFQGKLYDVGSYPVAIPSDKETDKILGELFEIENPGLIFSKLDEYEGYNPQKPESSLFIREKVTVYKLDGNSTKSAWICLYNRPVDGLTHIPGGNYLEYLKSEQDKG